MRIKEIRILGLFGMFDHIIPLNLDSHLSIIYGVNGIGKTTIFKILDNIFSFDANKSSVHLGEIATEISIIFTDDSKLVYSGYEDPKIFYQKTEIKPFTPEFNNFIAQTNVFFIQSQRLIFFNKNSNQFTESVTKYAQEISKIIQNKKQAYEKLSESLQLSLGKRMSKKEVKTNLSKEELHKIVAEVEKRRSELKAVGILEDSPEDSFDIVDDDPLAKAVLSVNLQDMQTKLKIFDDLYSKLSTFLEILNERRLSYKKISISEKNGFVFIDQNGKNLNPNDLSSGEQNELILLYLLLFEVPENALILIDEPEISLHIDWQSDFLKDMEDIIKLRKFDMLISTHSPDIINGRNELTIPLYGKAKN